MVGRQTKDGSSGVGVLTCCGWMAGWLGNCIWISSVLHSLNWPGTHAHVGIGPRSACIILCQ